MWRVLNMLRDLASEVDGEGGAAGAWYVGGSDTTGQSALQCPHSPAVL